MNNDKKKMNQYLRFAILGVMGVGIVLTGYAAGTLVFKPDKPVVKDEPKPPVEVVQEENPAPPIENPQPEPVEPETPVKEPTEESPSDTTQKHEEKVEEYIDYKVVEKDDMTLEEGKTRVIQEGQLGKKLFTYEVTLANGMATQRKLVSEEVIIPAKDRIILIGKKKLPVITTKTITEIQAIPFDTEYVEDISRPVGYEKVEINGIDGEILRTIEVTYSDGKEKSRKVLSATTTKEAKTEIIVVGVMEEAEIEVPEDVETPTP